MKQKGVFNVYKMLKPDFHFEDDRGTLIQLVHCGYRQVNVIRSIAGVIRGGHYHKKNHEAFYVVEGDCEVTFIEGERKQTRVFSAGEFFQIEPHIGHVFHYLSNTVMIGLYDLGVEEENGEKDIFPING